MGELLGENQGKGSSPISGNKNATCISFEEIKREQLPVIEQLLSNTSTNTCAYLIKKAPSKAIINHLKKTIKQFNYSHIILQAKSGKRPTPNTIYYPPPGYLCELYNGKISLKHLHLTLQDPQFLAIKESEQYYRSLFEMNPYPKWIYEKDTLRILNVNQAAMDLYGYSKEEFKELTLKDLRPSSDLSKLLDIQKEIKDQEGVFHFGIINHLTKSGGLLFMDLHGHHFEYQGKGCVLVTGKDVTERERAFLALKDKEENLEQAQRIAKLGNWEFHLENESVHWSDNMLLLWEVDLNTPHPSLAYFFKTIHPDDRQKFLLYCSKGLKTQSLLEISFRVITKSGKVKWMNLIGRLDKNNSYLLRGTVQDITQQKEEIHKLRLLERVITHSSDGVMVTEAENQDNPGPLIEYVNDAMCEVSGYSKEELIGQNPRILQGSKTDRKELDKLKQAIKEWRPYETTLINYKKTGEEYFNHFSLTPVADETGWFTHWIAIERDVTKHKIREMQKELMASISQFSQRKCDASAYINYTLHQVSLYGAFDLAEAWLLDEHSSDFNLQSQSKRSLLSLFIRGNKASRNEGFLGEIYRNQTVKIWEDPSEVGHIDKRYRFSSKHKVMGIPILSDARLLGVLLLANNASQGSLFSAQYQSDFYEELGRHLGKDLKRIKLDEDLKKSNERYEKLTEAANDAIYDWDLKTNEVYLGKGFYDLFGYDFKSSYSFDCWMERVHEEERMVLMSKMEAILEAKTTTDSYKHDYRYQKSNGDYAQVIDRGMVIRNQEGTPIRLLGAIQDISYRKEYEESLKRLNKELTIRANELSRSNSELEQFAYVASHDLQEPLRMISSFLKLLEKRYREKLDIKALEYISFAVDGANRMRKILLDLLEFSRVGRNEDAMEEISLQEVVEEACLLLKRKIQNANAQVTMDELPILQGYRSPLVQVFFNLISNAIKYRKASEQPNIHISCIQTRDSLLVMVKDNGIGIEEEYKDKIFEIFQRLHGKSEYEGTGMGLAIVKKIMESHGGKIELASTLNEGSSFTLTFPKPVTTLATA
ncbi:PAS domain-containing sensor histidine kinase [Pleomorphovibrio marinus]|uniref:PAS domain-containing sensor histidine kinase n=1 Tax=Pleomorphovibrio marinus TaxID=2164132 RepID=UPI000E0BE283|nr:PAS domain S-box protein [Pleomorphovibrio marinus]